MAERLRIIVCQLECHPAFYRDRLACLEEPFMPESYEASLSHLGTHGIPITSIQEFCKKAYSSWHQDRLRSLLSHPLLNEGIPSLLVFPEGSIPLICLKILHDFAKANKTTVVAGSHTILNTIEARGVYALFGKEEALGKAHKYNKDVAIIFVNNKIHHQKKQGASPYDRTDITSIDPPKITIHPIPIPIGESELRLAALVCADALQLPNIKGDYDLASIISYDKNPSHFDSFIGTQSDNAKIVIYCNDGRFGGSCIAFSRDRRPTSMFYSAPLEGRLPRGDILLVMDIATGDLATQVGVSNPKAQWDLRLLASLTYEKSHEGYQGISKQLKEISAISSNQARQARLDVVLKNNPCNDLQKYKIDQLRELARTGIDAEDIWQAYGNDFVINQVALTDLEGSFAALCLEKLTEHMIDGDLEPHVVGFLQSYLRRSKRRMSSLVKPHPASSTKTAQAEETYINREDEIAKMLTFLDGKNQFLFEVTGLAQIGKSAIIKKTLARTAFGKMKNIQLMDTSSVDYILAEIGSNDSMSCSLTSPKPQPFSELGNTLAKVDVLWLENCERLLEGRQWKSEDIEKLIDDVLDIAPKAQTKVIFESATVLPFKLRDPSVLYKSRIRGFERDLVKHGVSILDRQLRRLNLSPNDIPEETKKSIVEELGGHPLAIIFCADAIYEEGLSSVIDLVKRGTGFYSQVVEDILKAVALSEEDKHILRVLSGFRIEAPRDAVAAVCNFPVTEAISNLIRQCLVEVISPSTISLPGILRKTFRFSDLDKEVRKSLHRTASHMYTQMAKGHSGLRFAIEAEYHANLSGETQQVATGLIDGSLAAAKKFYEERNFTKAKGILETLVTENASDDVLRLSALVEAESGNLESALRKADKLLSRNPYDNRLYYILGKAALSQSKLELAEKLVWIGRKVGVAGTRVAMLQGRIALRRRDFVSAEAHFRQVLTSPKPEPWAYFYLGRTYLRMGRVTEAIEVLYEGDTFLENNPQRFSKVKNPIRTQLALAYVLNGDLEAASVILDALVKEEPNTPEVLYAYWVMTVMKNGVEKASEAFEVFRSARPKPWERGYYHLYHGLFHKALGDLPRAREEFALAHKYDSCNVYIMIQYAETLYTLSIRARGQDDMKLARALAFECAKVVRRILEFDSENPFAGDLEVDLFYEFDIQLHQVAE